MRIRDIEIILAVAETGSFSKAADAMQVTQPATSLSVRRTEEELGVVIFERIGHGVRPTPDGVAALKSFKKILTILKDFRDQRSERRRLKIGLSPLLSGRDATQLVGTVTSVQDAVCDIEFLDSHAVSARHDFDLRVVLPSLRREATSSVHIPTRWIGVRNGTFIYCHQESEIWDRARLLLTHGGAKVDKVIEVNDCGYAYHMAVAGAGFTPCVMTRNISFHDHILDGLPEIPPTRIDIIADHALAASIAAKISGELTDVTGASNAA